MCVIGHVKCVCVSYSLSGIPCYSMSEPRKRVCIVGGGPTGMCALYHLKLIAGDSVDIKCYEKQTNWRGMWNYSWRTGTDEYGETIPYAMYKHLWTIGPKEALEAKDYFFQDHFGKDLPTFLPRELIAQYLDGRWTKGKCGDLTNSVDFRHAVHNVDYREETDDFAVTVRDLRGQTDKEEIFSHVIVGTGNFSVANIPDLPGIDTFPGSILHAKDFRNALAFKGKSVLIIGGSFSASEIALQLIKYKCTSRVVISSRKATLDTDDIIEGFDVRVLPERIDQNHVTFKDGSTASFDVIIFCTGYIYHFPFLNGSLHFDFEGKKSTLYPPNLYKGSVWLKGGNNKLFHIGAYETYFNMTVWDAQAIWIANFILGKIPGQPLSDDEMKNDADKWCKRASVITDPWNTIDFMRDFTKDLCNDIGFDTIYADKIHALLSRTIHSRKADVRGYRDDCYPNMYTGKVAPKHHTKWIDCLDDAVDQYLS